MYSALFWSQITSLVCVCMSLEESCGILGKNDECATQQKSNTLQGSSQALVVYDETKISPFYLEKKHYRFAGEDVTIKQDWENLGVAAVVWDAAVVLCEYLERRPHLVKDKKIIELGAGSGIVSIVAALLGAEVTVTDREIALTYLEKVVSDNLNRIKPDSNFSMKPLDWTADRGNFSPIYDVIIGADIIYIEEAFDDLLKTFLHLSTQKTVIILSCRIRYERDNTFLDMLRQHFVLKKVYYDKTREVNIFRGTRIQ